MALRPPKGVKEEPAIPFGGGMARHITRRGIVRALQRVLKKDKDPSYIKHLIKDRAGIKKVLKEGSRKIDHKAALQKNPFRKLREK